MSPWFQPLVLGSLSVEMSKKNIERNDSSESFCSIGTMVMILNSTLTTFCGCLRSEPLTRLRVFRALLLGVQATGAGVLVQLIYVSITFCHSLYGNNFFIFERYRSRRVAALLGGYISLSSIESSGLPSFIFMLLGWIECLFTL